jgi:cobalamin biosynthesis Mg chelatase CobN
MKRSAIQPILLVLFMMMQTLFLSAGFAQDNQKQGLPPDKKKSLSRFGPEDIFPGEAPREERRSTAGRSSPAPRPSNRSRSSRNTEAATSLSTVASPVQSNDSTPQVDPAQPTINPSANQNQTSYQPRQQSSQQSNPGWLLAILAALTLLVLTALVFVLFKLMGKLRETS